MSDTNTSSRHYSGPEDIILFVSLVFMVGAFVDAVTSRYFKGISTHLILYSSAYKLIIYL